MPFGFIDIAGRAAARDDRAGEGAQEIDNCRASTYLAWPAPI
jgi:hypothetical protein